jgi:hypothetical protein
MGGLSKGGYSGQIGELYNITAEIEQRLAHINAELEVSKKSLEGESSSGSSGGGGLNQSMRVFNAGANSIKKFTGGSDLADAMGKMQAAANTALSLQLLLDFSNPLTAGLGLFNLGVNIASQVQSGGV